jgi:serine/threonine protein phosphatase PrpC
MLQLPLFTTSLLFNLKENISLEKDALTAGVSQIGGLFTIAEIRVLICYIFSKIDDAVPGNLFANTLHYEGIANCFEVNDSIAYLCDNGQLELVSREDDTYRITEKGKDVAETLKTTLSIVVKERAYNAAIKMVSRFRNAKETDIKISREDNKIFITCSAIDNKTPFMSVKLLVSDEEQAVHIKEKFLSDPTKIYSSLIDLLTK